MMLGVVVRPFDHFLELFPDDGHRHSLDDTILTCPDRWNSHLQAVVLHKLDRVLHYAQTARLIRIERQDLVILFVIICEPW